ncbi:EAL domain-containing protein, partial [Mesorhizobium sp. M5C.F.Ca.ET.164.01.1.1]|uniref:EAL domain-containing protein n=1 Tax=Mesorhizobium sp. M5C.F.Ca.ET.164.01.1.1 TaxID=2563957 RepID=UPI001FEFF897
GTGHSTEERVSLLQPDIVKIDGGWFAEFCRHAAAERFFRPLVSSLHDRGAKVLVEGIEQPTHLRVALEGGLIALNDGAIDTQNAACEDAGHQHVGVD